MPQQWASSPLYQPQYQSPAPAVGRGNSQSVPYAFGQLPNTANPADPKSQHPIPGSFVNRHAFNPKTQSFVPGTGLPITQPMSHHGSPHQQSSHHGSPHQSPHLSFNPYPTPQQQFGGNMGYNMARQGSNSSLPSYHASPHMAPRPMMHQNMQQGGPQGMSHGGLPGMPPNPSQSMSMASHNGQSGNLVSYGNPATLPPKPPAGL